MTDEQGRASEKRERVKLIDIENVEFELGRKAEKRNRLDGQYSTILSEPCTPHKSSLAEKLIKSVGEDSCMGVRRHYASYMGARSTNSDTTNVPKFSSFNTPHGFC